MRFPLWNIVFWAVIALVVLGMEFLGVYDGKDYLTITYVIRNYVPWWIQAMVWGWLAGHFWVTELIKKLK